jgi:hypothetical protein
LTKRRENSEKNGCTQGNEQKDYKVLKVFFDRTSVALFSKLMETVIVFAGLLILMNVLR